tara:strand:- start:1113 stop:1406 length:294 start_codon:yes stop_codon:yes gene_type:complete
MSDEQSNPLGLPLKETKKWKVNKTTKVENDYKPLFPTFCPCVDPETDKKCGNFMRNWDQMFYDKAGMCEECYGKYNSHIEEIEKETKKQLEANGTTE